MIPELPGTWWTYYADAAGNRAILTTHITQNAIHLRTSEGERLRFTPAEFDVLVSDLSVAAAEARRLHRSHR